MAASTGGDGGPRVGSDRSATGPWFGRFWAASAVSDLGTYVTVVAVPVLVLKTMGGSATDVGLVSAARWLPYLLFGVLVGVLVDRARRRPLLVATDGGRGALLVLVPLLAYLGVLGVPLLAVLMAAFGMLSLVGDAAHQSFLPRLVPRPGLALANSRLEGTAAVAQTAGPALGGTLVAVLGAPVAIIADAVSYLVSAVLLVGVRVAEPPPPARPERGRRGAALWAELREGLRWVYRHRTLMPLAVSTHVWFLFFSVLNTAYPVLVLRGLELGALDFGLTLALGGVGALAGAVASTRVCTRLGVVRTVAGAHLTQAAGFAVVAATLLPGDRGRIAQVALLAAGQFLVGLGMGVEGPITMSYRQGVTPDRLQGRMNTTMRSVNRAVVVVGAPLGGLLVDSAGFAVTMVAGVTGLVVGAVVVLASPLRHARTDDDPETHPVPPGSPEPVG